MCPVARACGKQEETHLNFLIVSGTAWLIPKVHLGRCWGLGRDLPLPPTQTLVSTQAAPPSAARRVGSTKSQLAQGTLFPVGGEPRLRSPEARSQVEKWEQS